MAQKKNKSEKPAQPASAAGLTLRRVAIHLSVLLVLGGCAALGLSRLKRYVEQTAARTDAPLIIVLKNKPNWMTDGAVREIADAARPPGEHSAFDHRMLVDVRSRLEACGWVEQVRQVRRAFSHSPGDTLEIDCIYRVPAALVHWGRYYWLVDQKAVKLPEQFLMGNVPRTLLGEDGHVNLRLIDGVQKPPPEAGHVWPGHDLAAGLEMAAVLFDRPYTDEIVKIDVSNVEGRQDPKEPHVTLVTKYGSRILWGRVPSSADAFIESSAETKLKSLQTVYATLGRVDAHQPWIDIRLDGVLGATPPPPQDNPAHARLDHTR